MERDRRKDAKERWTEEEGCASRMDTRGTTEKRNGKKERISAK
tara:strand:+ start:1548 stop:1676 length:129 start_codon:yes stop_codon:yes gene_type:complete